MRVLVTGGAGYIGSHTLLELMGQGHEVCVLDSYLNSSREVLRRVRALSNGGHVEEVEGDVRDAGLLDRAFAGFRPEAVIHFAGLKAVGESGRQPLDYYDVNVRGTVELARAMDRAGCGRIVFSSSATVYGTPRYLPYDEAHPTNPENVYGRTKLMAEQILRDWAAASGGTAALLRYFNPVGAHASGRIGEDPTGVPDNLMPFVAQVAVGRRERLQVFGDDYDTRDGTGVRDYLHVSDLAAAHVAALGWAARSTGAEAFNVGSGQGISVKEMVRAFAAASGRDIPVEVAPRRQGDIAEFYADPARAEAALGWRATRGVEEMCADVWRWQSANPEGYGR